MEDVDAAAVERIARELRRLRRYCRLETEGLENLPQGPFVVVANHTGWAGLDYANLFITLHDATGRIPRVAAHPSFFKVPRVGDLGERLGFFEASVATSTRVLDAGGIVTFFPEGEEGNFKPIWKRYRLQPFKPGFARVALATQAPVVPVVIVGGEDASPSLGRVRPLEDILDMPVPIPATLLPLPVKWRIAVLPPVDPGRYLEAESPDKDHAEVLAHDLRRAMQKELDAQLVKRGNPFV
ncbi:MAG TPA: 1-acyl-sn-glycerol-3-phosphate acyltransferase [Candidatus Thermoplasmatota archaeon]|nr:1-acyl-sn-glycerol-3-phosphate acyltransferase [Candidatus Thermoplasmatota archaeon]